MYGARWRVRLKTSSAPEGRVRREPASAFDGAIMFRVPTCRQQVHGLTSRTDTQWSLLRRCNT